ncbi:hypothetical protein L1286_06845 [Pseudoalteromonas sp. SMS1]|uniref:hypothetical protein n=1 Tax=Pseudoalteromonas sp. SMS1 TaxID=2908894 RepID=UPI001F16BC4B|nr:hypothetical protein [Pseudoalteromonas sp. SMS1]MCF2857178.1 hypothetical protein [Pseudoalteromonas sp. SMS1]
MKLKLTCTSLIAASLAVAVSQAHAAEIKVDELIQQKVHNDIRDNENHPYNVAASRTCSGGLSGMVCRLMAKVGIPPLVSNIKLYDVGTDYSAIKQPAIPETVEFEYYSVKNCTSTPRKLDQEVTVTFNESNTIRVTDKVTTTSNAKVEAKLQLEIFSFGGSGGVTKVVDVTKESSSTTNTSKVIREVLKEDIKPYTALIYTVDKRYSNAYIDFTGNFSFNADLTFEPSKKLVGPYSRFFNDDQLSVSGQVWNVSYKSVSKSYLEVPLPTNYSECNAFSVDQYMPNSVRHRALSL